MTALCCFHQGVTRPGLLYALWAVWVHAALICILAPWIERRWMSKRKLSPSFEISLSSLLVSSHSVLLLLIYVNI